ncbi:hypothetical protein BN1708_017879, partial [Verticillium longisporum]
QPPPQDGTPKGPLYLQGLYRRPPPEGLDRHPHRLEPAAVSEQGRRSAEAHGWRPPHRRERADPHRPGRQGPRRRRQSVRRQDDQVPPGRPVRAQTTTGALRGRAHVARERRDAARDAARRDGRRHLQDGWPQRLRRQ